MKHNVEERRKKNLNSPFFKIAMRGNWTAKILVKFLEYINETWGNLDTLRNREREAHRLTRAMIRVLTQDDSLDPVKRGGVESVEDQVSRRVDGKGAAANLILDELGEGLGVGFLKLRGERFQPRLLHQ